MTNRILFKTQLFFGLVASPNVRRKNENKLTPPNFSPDGLQKYNNNPNLHTREICVDRLRRNSGNLRRALQVR